MRVITLIIQATTNLLQLQHLLNYLLC